VSRKSAPRHRSRQVALQVLYALDLAKGARTTGDRAASVEETFDRVAENFDLPEGARAFAKELACGTTEAQATIDQLLTDHAINWRVSRMATIDRNVLRLAVFELLHTATPRSVILDEAIELARRFGTEASPPFVNGVLDSVAHVLAPGRIPEEPA